MLHIKRILIKDHLSEPLRHLYAHKVFKGIATGLLGFFVPLFLFKTFGNIQAVIWYYLAMHIVTMIAYPWATKFLLKFDLKKLMIVATIFIVSYLLILNQFKNGSVSWWLIVLAVITLTTYRLLYWTPYHTEFVTFTEKHYRGRELSVLNSIIQLVGIFLPIIAAWIVVSFGFNWLFIVVLCLHIMSAIPLIKIPEKREEYSYGYKETWRELFSKKNRGLLLAYFGDGFQGTAGYVVWPIFIFLVLQGQYMTVGIVSSFIILVTVVLQLLIGDLTDHKNKRKILKTGSWMFSLGWLIKTFIETGFQIFVVGVYHGLSEILMRTPLDTLMYDKMADNEHYIDEYTVLREMALRIGKIAVLITTLLILSFASLNWVFILVSLVALMVNFI